jgi:hypothetical protein
MKQVVKHKMKKNASYYLIVTVGDASTAEKLQRSVGDDFRI